MQPEFWQEKWQRPQQGFNQAKPNTLLIEHFKDLGLAKDSTVFVPLAGKSIDMIWLAEQGYNVIGIELIESAVQDFFTDYKISASIIRTAKEGQLTCYQGKVGTQTIDLWAGNIFDLIKIDIGKIDAVYDRAALVALPDDGENSLRRRYVQKVIELTNIAPQLLLNFTLNEAALSTEQIAQRKEFGPPFVIDDENTRAYYQAVYDVQFITKEEADESDVLVNQAWLLTPDNNA